MPKIEVILSEIEILHFCPEEIR